MNLDQKVITLAEDFKTNFITPRGSIIDIIKEENAKESLPFGIQRNEIKDTLRDFFYSVDNNRVSSQNSYEKISEMIALASIEYVKKREAITSKEMTKGITDVFNEELNYGVPNLILKRDLILGVSTRKRKKISGILLKNNLKKETLGKFAKRNNLDYAFEGIYQEFVFYLNETDALGYLLKHYLKPGLGSKKEIEVVESSPKIINSKSFELASSGKKKEGGAYTSWETAQRVLMSKLNPDQRKNLKVDEAEKIIQNSDDGTYYVRTIEAFVAKSNFNSDFANQFYKK